MQVHFIGAPTINEPLEFGFSVLPFYTTMRDGGIVLVTSLALGLVSSGICGPWLGLVCGCGGGVMCLIATQYLRRRFGYYYITELGMACGWTRDRDGFLGDTRRARILSHAWLSGEPTRSVSRSVRRSELSLRMILRYPSAAQVVPPAPGSWPIQRGILSAQRRTHAP